MGNACATLHFLNQTLMFLPENRLLKFFTNFKSKINCPHTSQFHLRLESKFSRPLQKTATLSHFKCRCLLCFGPGATQKDPNKSDTGKTNPQKEREKNPGKFTSFATYAGRLGAIDKGSNFHRQAGLKQFISGKPTLCVEKRFSTLYCR